MAFLAGCETDSADSEIYVTPESVVMVPGQTQEFVAHDGYDYRWSLNPDDGSGRLNTTVGDRVIYTCLATNVGASPKRVVVSAFIKGTASGASTNNAAPYSASAEAHVYYPTPTGGGSTGTASLKVTPSAAAIGTGGTQALSASGGTPPYTWSVKTASLGSVFPTSGQSVVYSATATPGTNTVSCLDAAGANVLVTITQN